MDDNKYAEKIDFAKAIMQHSSHLISLADTKAGMLLGINGIILALLLGLERQGTSYLSIVFLIGTGIALSLSSVFAILTIIPRLSIGTEWASFIYFKSIIEKTREEYSHMWDNLNTSGILNDYLKNIYNLALIQEEKFKNLLISVILIILGVIFLALLLISNYVTHL